MLSETPSADSSTETSPSHVAAPLVSIIMACRCEAPNIRTLLASILSQKEVDGGFEVIVADGMSEDGTREIVQTYADSDRRVQLIDNPGRIVSTGLNTAIRIAQGRIIVRMDAHTRYAPDYVYQSVSVLKETKADNVGGPWIAEASGYLGTAIAAAFQSAFSVGGARSHFPHHEGPVDSVYLGCWKREAFDRFGGFDEEFIRNQDDEHNLRIVRGGGTIWQSPRIRSWYDPRKTLDRLFQQFLQYGYWKVKVIRKHKRPSSLRQFVPAVFVLVLGLLLSICGLSFLISASVPPNSILYYLSDWLMSRAAMVLACILSLYVLALAVASLATAYRTCWKLLAVLPAVFVCYHFGYGLGFLMAIADMVVGRKSASLYTTALTRNPTTTKCHSVSKTA